VRSYRYVDGQYETRSEIKRSLFIATVKGELDAEGAEEFVKLIKKRYPDATHNCYAYISDALGNSTRFSDDGEPGGTAGQPILDVLKKQGLVKTAIVVTRYFGGIKLGAGGLVGAYSGAAADAVKAATIATKSECKKINVTCDYADYAAVEKLIRKSACKLGDVTYGDGVSAYIFVPSQDESAFLSDLRECTADRAQSSVCDGVFYEKV